MKARSLKSPALAEGGYRLLASMACVYSSTRDRAERCRGGIKASGSGNTAGGWCPPCVTLGFIRRVLMRGLAARCRLSNCLRVLLTQLNDRVESCSGFRCYHAGNPC